MSRANDSERLRHILAAIGDIESFLGSSDLKTFLASRKDQLAVCMSFAIIGEAAGKISVDLCSLHPEIPWREMVSMRNVVIHGYGDTDFQTVWDTAKNDLPQLKAQITAILAEIPPQ